MHEKFVITLGVCSERKSEEKRSVQFYLLLIANTLINNNMKNE